MKKKRIGTKKEKNGGGLVAGASIGAVLGIAAGILLAPETGKKMRTDIKKLSGDFYRHIAPQLKKLRVVGEAQYHAVVAEGVRRYAKARRLSRSEEKLLATEGKRAWFHMKRNLL